MIEYGKLNPGSLTYDEYFSLVNTENMYKILNIEIKNSFIEKGDYLKQLNYTLDAEAYAFSGGALNPVDL